MIIEFINYTINGALLGLLYSLVAMGFVVIYRASKVFNMAIGEMIVLGAFLLWWAIQSRGMHPALGIEQADAFGQGIERGLQREVALCQFQGALAGVLGLDRGDIGIDADDAAIAGAPRKANSACPV